MKRLLLWLSAPLAFIILYVAVGRLREASELSPEAAPPLWLTVGTALVALPLVFAFFLSRSLRRQASLEVRPLAGSALSSETRVRVAELEALGFSALGGAIAFGSRGHLRVQPLLAGDRRAFASVFEHGARPTRGFDFDSRLEDGRLLMTTSDPLAGRAPFRADVLIQVMATGSPAELFARHLEALSFLGHPTVDLGSTSEDYVTFCRDGAGRLYDKIGMREAIRVLVPGRSPHTTPIPARKDQGAAS